jgi:hypothetical protein
MKKMLAQLSLSGELRMETTVTVQCKCPKCGHEWEEEQDVEVDPPIGNDDTIKL